MATKKVNNQLDIQITSTLLNSGAGYIGLGAKSDGLYQKNNTGSDLKLATTTDLSGYLPLTGGTISGNTTDLLTISAGASVSHALIVKNVSGTEIASILGNGNIVSTAGNFIGNGFLDPNTNKQGITVDSTNLYFKTNGATRGVITNSGNFLIGTTTDDGINKLQVNGTVKLAINKYINFVQDDEQPILQTSRSDGTYINYLYASGAGDFRFSKNLTVTGNITVGVSTGTQVSLLSGGYITVNSPSTSDNLVIRGKNAGGIYMNYGSGNSGSTSF